MGLGFWTVTFETELPSFAAIQSLYYAQTGLHIRLKANLHLRSLKTSYTEIFSLFQQDAEAVAKLEKEKEELYQSHAHQYEEIAKLYHKTNKKLRQLSIIDGVQFTIDGFYEVNFSVVGKRIEIETFHSLEYGIDSLVKVLIDLGGNLEGSYPERWKRLKKWKEYKWYNRPKK